MEENRIIHRANVTRKAVAFTFDDGPSPEFTPPLLEIFREHGGKATFFMIGEQIDKYPETAAAVRDEGHEIGNHSYTHPALAKLDAAARQAELQRTDERIESLTGRRPVTFRPPYFSYDEQLGELADSFGYRTIGCVNGEAKDWSNPGVDHIVEKTRETIAPGSILIFHDGYENRGQTVEAVRILARELAEAGYELVTASELLRMEAAGE